METVCIGLGDRRRRASRTLGLLVPLILVRSFVTSHHAKPDQTQTSLAGPVDDGDWIRIHPRSSIAASNWSSWSEESVPSSDFPDEPGVESSHFFLSLFLFFFPDQFHVCTFALGGWA